MESILIIIITISSVLNLCYGVVQQISFMNGRTLGGGTIRHSLWIFAALILASFSFLFYNKLKVAVVGMITIHC